MVSASGSKPEKKVIRVFVTRKITCGDVATTGYIILTTLEG
jgi:hypothetical protein